MTRKKVTYFLHDLTLKILNQAKYNIKCIVPSFSLTLIPFLQVILPIPLAVVGWYKDKDRDILICNLFVKFQVPFLFLANSLEIWTKHFPRC